MMTEKTLTHDEKLPGRLICRVDLSALYPIKREFAEFEKRYNKFRICDESTRAVYDLKNHKLIYQSEQLIPSKASRNAQRVSTPRAKEGAGLCGRNIHKTGDE
jgi:hypothetical protein